MGAHASGPERVAERTADSGLATHEFFKIFYAAHGRPAPL
jgi:hypothetical protein